MARVEDCTLEAVKLLSGELCDAVGERIFFEYNPGNHFADPEGADGKGIPVAAAGGMTGGRTGSEPERVWSI